MSLCFVLFEACLKRLVLVDPKETLDSLYIDSRSGIISIFFDNDPSFGLMKPDNTLFSKLITKARS